MKIGLICPQHYTIPPVYGGEIMIYHLMQALTDLGHEINLFARYGSETPENGKLLPQRSCYGDWQRMIDTEQDSIRYDQKYLRECDIIHDWSHEKYVSDWCNQEGVPFISTLWGTTWRRPNCKTNITCWSNAHREAGLKGLTGFEGTGYESFGSPSGNIPDAKVVPGGTDTEFYTPCYEKEDYFVWISRATPYKGIEIAIKLAKEMGFKLKVSGSFSGSDHGRYGRKWLEIIKGASNVEYVPTPDHQSKRDLLQKAKAMIFPTSYIECFGLIVVESLSCATPVITSNMGAMPEIITPLDNGFICNKYGDYKNAIINVDMIDLKRVRKTTVEKFDKKIVASNYLKLYKEVIEGGKW